MRRLKKAFELSNLNNFIDLSNKNLEDAKNECQEILRKRSLHVKLFKRG